MMGDAIVMVLVSGEDKRNVCVERAVVASTLFSVMSMDAKGYV